MTKINPDDPTFGETPPRHKKRARRKTKEEKLEKHRLWKKKFKEKYGHLKPTGIFKDLFGDDKD